MVSYCKMKQINIREFCLRPASYLKELPVTLTRYGKPVASIIPVGSFKISSEVLEEKDLTPKAMTPTLPLKPAVMEYDSEAVVATRVVPFTLNKAWKIWVCPHNNESGQCPMGCIREVK